MTGDSALVFEQLGKALTQLENALKRQVSADRLEIDGTIQRFEFCVELFWKALKKKLFVDFGVEVNGPKVVIQL